MDKNIDDELNEFDSATPKKFNDDLNDVLAEFDDLDDTIFNSSNSFSEEPSSTNDDFFNSSKNISNSDDEINDDLSDNTTETLQNFDEQLDNALSEFDNLDDNIFNNDIDSDDLNDADNDLDFLLQNLQDKSEIKSTTTTNVSNGDDKSVETKEAPSTPKRKPRFVVNTHEDEQDEDNLEEKTQSNLNEIDTSDLDNMSSDDLFNLILNDDDDENENEDDLLSNLKNINKSDDTDDLGLEEIDDDDETLSDAIEDTSFTEEKIDEVTDNETNETTDLKDDDITDNAPPETSSNSDDEIAPETDNTENVANPVDNVFDDEDNDLLSLLGIDSIEDINENIGSLTEDELDKTLNTLRKQNERNAKLAEEDKKFSLKKLLTFSSLIYSFIVIGLLVAIFINLGIVRGYENLLDFNISDSPEQLLELDRIIWETFSDSENSHSTTNDAFYKYLDGNFDEDELIKIAQNNIEVQASIADKADEVHYKTTSNYIFNITNFAYLSSLESEQILNFIDTKDINYLTIIKNNSAEMVKSKNSVLLERNEFLKKIRQLN